ncbi:MAG: hypothetical protein ABJH63_08450 [Rhizobiaceae bacterium]
MTTINWTGSSGTRYEMDIVRLGISVPNYAGVYILCKPQDGLWSAYYVGEAEDIGNRLGDTTHFGRDCAMRHGASYVATASVAGGKNARMSVERDLLEAYDPRCNG